jgi:dsDNA-specific endonuclease/ATPase MutS2
MAFRRSDADASAPDPEPDEVEDATLLPIEETLDLHTFAPRDVPDLVREYLAGCVRRGFHEVRVIHGRGTGTQRAIVRSVLTGHPLVATFADAPPDRGGWGATVVRLRDATHTVRSDQ